MFDLAGALKRSRERSGLSQDAAASAVGINRVVLSYYESGRRSAPLPTVMALAGLYGTTLDALLAGDEDASTIDVSGILFRAAPNALGEPAEAGIRLLGHRLREYVDLAAELGRQLPGKGRSPFPGNVGLSGRDATAAARRLRRHLSLGGGPVSDVFRVADEDVLVWRLPMGADLDVAPSGLFYNHPQAGFSVVVNSDMTLGRQVFTVAHELAHAYFHSSDLDVIVSMSGAEHRRERFADTFAGEFLVPGDELRRLAEEHAKWSDLTQPATVIHLQRHFRVSYATLRVRLLQERLIDRAAYEALAGVSPNKLARALGYHVEAADMGDYEIHPLERIPGRMLMLVRSALDAGVITTGDAAETLGTSTEEVRQLMARPAIDAAERHAQQDVEAAAFAHKD